MPNNEEELVNRVRQGNTDAFGAIYELYFDRLYRFIFFKVREQETAEDLTEQVFVRALESLGSFRWERPSLAPWLFRIAQNLVIDHIRRLSRRPTVPLQEERKTGSEGAAIEDLVHERLAAEELRVAIQGLTDLQQQVINLRFMAGLSNEEVARMLNKTVGSVKAAQHSALEALRRILGKRGYV